MSDINFYLPDDVHTALKIAAAKSGLFAKDIMIEAIRNHKLVKAELNSTKTISTPEKEE